MLARSFESSPPASRAPSDLEGGSKPQSRPTAPIWSKSSRRSRDPAGGHRHLVAAASAARGAELQEMAALDGKKN